MHVYVDICLQNLDLKLFVHFVLRPEDLKIIWVVLYEERRRVRITLETKHYSFSLFYMNDSIV